MMLCLQETNHQAWAECFGNFLEADKSVMVVSGMIINEEKLNTVWNTGEKPGKSVNVIPYFKT